MLIDWLIEEYFNTWIYTVSEFFKTALITLVIGSAIISVILAKVVGK